MQSMAISGLGLANTWRRKRRKRRKKTAPSECYIAVTHRTCLWICILSQDNNIMHVENKLSGIWMPPLTLLVYYTNQLNVKLNDLILKTSLQFHHLVTIIPKKLCFLLFTLQYENTISDLSTLERERDLYTGF